MALSQLLGVCATDEKTIRIKLAFQNGDTWNQYYLDLHQRDVDLLFSLVYGPVKLKSAGSSPGTFELLYDLFIEKIKSINLAHDIQKTN